MKTQHTAEFLDCAATFCAAPTPSRLVYNYETRNGTKKDPEREEWRKREAFYAAGFCVWTIAHEANGLFI